MYKDNIELYKEPVYMGLSTEPAFFQHTPTGDKNYINALRLNQACFETMYAILQEANDINDLAEYKEKVDEAVSEAILLIKRERGTHDTDKIYRENEWLKKQGNAK